MDFYQEQAAEENRRLKNLLERALIAAGGLPPTRSRRDPLQVLDLACGECREAETLVQAVRSLRGESTAPVRLVGADIRDREIGIAADRFASRPDAQYEFFVEDGSKLDRNRELGTNFDLTFLRHQNYWHDPALWKKIFAQGLAKLSDEGLLVLTSYFDAEHELAKRAVEEVGGELILTHKNEHSLKLSYPGKSVDRHVAVFRRQKRHP